MNARTIAIEAMKGMYEVYGGSTPSDPKCNVLMELDAKCRDAIAALEAETGEPVAVTAGVVNQAIYAVDREAAKRGEMFPQTRDEQEEDRRAVSRVMGMISWYEKNTGCAKIKNWPVAAPPPAVPQWLPIESAPKDGTPYLAYDQYYGRYVESRPPNHYAGDWIFDADCRNQWRGHAHSDDREATHWQPLPSVPGTPA